MIDLRQGDSRDVLEWVASASIDAVVTDPPYSLVSIQKRFGKPGSTPTKDGDVYARASRGFMGQQWDTGETAFDATFWAEVLRVLKPGGHLVAFGGTRTYHRLACAIGDAGFEIRDMIGWLYGSGFPKSHNQKGEWEGWGTALKPAQEPIVLARRPLYKTIAENLAAYRAGVLNIDGCRVPSEGGRARVGEASQERRYTESGATNFAATPGPRGDDPNGRWPANIAHDGSDEVLAAFPDAPGQAAAAVKPNSGTGQKTGAIYGVFATNSDHLPRGDKGSAARFFYCAKASRKDREEGCELMPKKPLNWSSGDKNPGAFQSAGTDKTARNNHPTVKPTALMRWLCRLVTPPGGLILDPFMGSGSTGKAAALEGFRFLGIEREAEYVEIARARIAAVYDMTSDKLDGVFS